MRQYHPVDVRHPSNRQYLHRNYLLDPPPATPAPVTNRPQGSAAVFANATHNGSRGRAASVARQIATPWTRSAASDNRTAQRPSSRLGGLLRALLVLGFIGFIVARNSDALEPLLRPLRLWALQMGIQLPF